MDSMRKFSFVNFPHFRALYLGPWSDYGRKPTLLLPFVGHLISGVVPVLVVYFEGGEGGIIKSCLSPEGAKRPEKSQKFESVIQCQIRDKPEWQTISKRAT